MPHSGNAATLISVSVGFRTLVKIRIVGKILGKIDNADDAAKLLRALALPPMNDTSRPAQKM
jgi:hypothetical protein